MHKYIRLALSIAVLSAAVVVHAGATFRVTPYIQHPATNAMSILWFTEQTGDATLKWWRADADESTASSAAVSGVEAPALKKTSDGTTTVTQHKYAHRITGLVPDTAYNYKVTLAGDGGATYAKRFRTSPAAFRPVRFVAYSDSETQEAQKFGHWENPTFDLDNGKTAESDPRRYFVDKVEGFASNICAMVSREPDFIVAAGDLAGAGSQQPDWDRYWDHNAGKFDDPAGALPLLAAPGNHDYANYYEAQEFGEMGMGKFLTYFEVEPNTADVDADQKSRFHRVDYGPVALIFIDPNNGPNYDPANTYDKWNYEYAKPNLKDTNQCLTEDKCRAPDFNPGSAQYQWIEEQLADAQTNKLFTFLVCHQCPYSIGYHGRPNGDKGIIGGEGEYLSGVATRCMTNLVFKYGVDGWICGHDEICEHSRLTGTEQLAGGATTNTEIHVYDVGYGGDDLRGARRTSEPNPYEVFRAHTDSPEVYENGLLVSGGKHYGHLEVNVTTNEVGQWICKLQQNYVFVTTNALGQKSFDLRTYPDVVVLTNTTYNVPEPVTPGGDGLKPSGGDDYAAITNAIAQAETGGEVKLAAGTFNVLGTIEIKKDVKIVGAGKNETILSGAGYLGRGLYLDNAAAVVSSLTITGYSNTVNGAGVYLKNGTIRNAAITWCRCCLNQPRGGGVWMTGGSLIDSDILYNCSYHTGSGYSEGGGVYITGGVMEGCRVVGNIASVNEHNAGVSMSSKGTVRNCYIAQNVCSGSSYVSGGATGVMMDGGTLENSIVCSNDFGGVRISGGTMRNTLVFGHKHSLNCFAGVNNCGGTIEYCTITDNETTTDTSGHSGLKQTKGTTVNSIVYGNGSDGSLVGSVDVSGGKFLTNVTDKIVSIGIGCYVSSPKFKDAVAHDYHLGLGSVAIGHAAPNASVPKDLDGVTRNADGNGADIGCYEYVASSGGDIACAISIDSTEYAVGQEVVIKAMAEGGDGDYTYTWYLDNSATAVQTGKTDTYAWVEPTGGRHTVKVEVSDESGHAKSVTEQNLFSVRPTEVYVSLEGENDYPYDTSKKAAHSLDDALAAVWLSLTSTAIVHIAEGTYPISATMMFDVPVRILGAGADKTLIDSKKNLGRIMTIKHKEVEVRGVTLANADANVDAAGISMSDGLVADSVISNCLGYAMFGGGVIQSGGLITNCVITKCKAKRTGSGYTHGEGLYQTGGRVAGCLFRANFAAGEYFNSLGAYTTGGSIENSVFTGHNGSNDGEAGTPVEVAGGSLINCLIYGNTCKLRYSSNTRRTSGVVMTSGKVIHCTIADNATSGSCEAAPGLVVEGGTAINNIVCCNTSTFGTKGVAASAGTVSTNLMDCTLGYGIGNINGDPKFRGVSTNDYHLTLGSRAINAGTLVEDVCYDMDGTERNADEKGYDLGCYEYIPTASGPLTCSFTADKTTILHGDSVTVTATAEGGSGTGYIYRWYVNGSATPTLEGEGENTLVLTSPDYGRYSIRLEVEDSLGEKKEAITENAIAVQSLVAYADPNGSNTYPYETKAKAAHDVIDAYEALWTTAETAPALYIEPGTYLQRKTFVLERSFQIIGAGKDATILCGADYTAGRGIQVKHASAVVSDLTLTGFTNANDGAGMYLKAGTVRNVAVTWCKATSHNKNIGGGVYMDGGTMENCDILDNLCDGGYFYRWGGGIYMTGGTLDNCRIVSNSSSGNAKNGGLFMSGSSVVRNCYIAKNIGNDWDNGWQGAAGVVMEGGTLENSVVCSNGVGGVCISGGTMRNTLVSDDRHNSACYAGVYNCGGTIRFCTIAGNSSTSQSDKKMGFCQTKGTTLCSIIAGNLDTATVSGGTFATNLVDAEVSYAGQVGTVETSFSPFMHPSRGDYRIKGSSLAVDRGDDGVWNGDSLATATDVSGKPRLRGDRIDLGCYEWQPTGLMLLVR